MTDQPNNNWKCKVCGTINHLVGFKFNTCNCCQATDPPQPLGVLTHQPYAKAGK